MPALDVNAAQRQRASRSTVKANCVEVAVTAGAVAVRDSKEPAGEVLAASPHAWTVCTTALRNGKLS